MTATAGRGVSAVTIYILGVGRLGGRSAAAQLSPYARAALDLDASAAPSALLWQKPAEGLFSFFVHPLFSSAGHFARAPAGVLMIAALP